MPSSGLSSFTENYVYPPYRKSVGLLKTISIKFLVRFQKKPYSTTLIVIVVSFNLVPLLIFVLIMATLSSIYFLIYFVSFLAIAAAASFIIIPLLCISFIFASAVVVFGFLSDTTFRFAQSLYIKTDHRLKSTLSKMGTLKKKEKSEKEELAINTEKQHNDLRCRNLVESSGISSTNTNPDAHVFGTDVRVTK